jgi:hypothetical protein
VALLLALVANAALATAPDPALDRVAGPLARCVFRQVDGTPELTRFNAGRPGVGYRLNDVARSTRMELKLEPQPDNVLATLFLSHDSDWSVLIRSLYDREAQLVEREVELWLGGAFLDVTERQGLTIHVSRQDIQALRRSVGSMQRTLARRMPAPVTVRTQRPTRCTLDAERPCGGDETVREVPQHRVREASARFFANDPATKDLVAVLRSVSGCR